MPGVAALSGRSSAGLLTSEGTMLAKRVWVDIISYAFWKREGIWLFGCCQSVGGCSQTSKADDLAIRPKSHVVRKHQKYEIALAGGKKPSIRQSAQQLTKPSLVRPRSF